MLARFIRAEAEALLILNKHFGFNAARECHTHRTVKHLFVQTLVVGKDELFDSFPR